MVLTRNRNKNIITDKPAKSVNHHSEVSDYELERQKNIREKLDYLASLGVSQIKHEIVADNIKKKKEPVFRIRKVKENNEPLRRSLRVKKLPAEKVSVVPNEMLYYEPEERKEKKMSFASACLTQNDLPLDSMLSQFASRLHTNELNDTKDGKPLTLSQNNKLDSQFMKDMKSLHIEDYHARKMVPERIFSICWSTGQTPLFFAGDKIGSLGIWNTTLKEYDEQVVTFQPHNRPIYSLNMPISNPTSIYSSSYDASVRRGDLNKMVFEEVYGTTMEDGNLCKGLDFNSPDGSTFLLAQQDGTVVLVDTREDGKSGTQTYRCSNRSLRTLQVHPQNHNLFLTSSPDSYACIWDMRKMKGPSYLSTALVRMPNKKGVHSACFSPLTGSKVLTLSIDDNIRVFDVVNAKVEEFVESSNKENTSDLLPITCIPHNNHVGRWLTNFRATWHPMYEEYFVVGCMKQPRQVEIYSLTGSHVYSLTAPLLTSITSLNAFHPRLNMLGGGNSSGKAFIFTQAP